MARSDIHVAGDLTLSIVKNSRVGNFEPVLHPGVNAHSAHLKSSSIESRWGSFHSDTKPLVCRSSQFSDSKVFVPSLPTPGNPSSSEKEKRISMFSSAVTPGPSSCEALRQSSDSHWLMGASTLKTSSDGSGNQPPKFKGTAKAEVHMKPLLRKMSRDDTSSRPIDLSRSSFVQKGLGIYTNLEREDRLNDPFASYTFQRPAPGLHNRSTSGTSQLSAASSSDTSKPGSQCIHPMRQAPRSHTPPLGQSYQTSIIESDDSGNGDLAEGETPVQSISGTYQPFVRAPSGQKPRLSLQTHDNSFTRLPGISQTNVTCRSSFGYSRDHGSNVDPTSPMSRSSLDFVFRSKTRNSMDPISRAATVQAARQAFEEKEAAKTQKLEKQQFKAEEKQMRRKEKHYHWRSSLRDDEMPEPVSEKEFSERSYTPELPRHSSATSQPSGPQSGSWKSQPKNTWMLFITWLRTRVFKLRRKLPNLG